MYIDSFHRIAVNTRTIPNLKKRRHKKTVPTAADVSNPIKNRFSATAKSLVIFYKMLQMLSIFFTRQNNEILP